MRLIGRVVVISLNLFAAPLVVEAQPSRQVPRIGFLSYGAPTTIASPEREAFRQGLRELGWIEGQTVTIEYRWAEGNPQRLPALARDLIQLKVDVIVTSGTGAIRAAKEATSTIPIVFVVLTDPVSRGLVKGFAHPGGNLTGLASQFDELLSKQPQLMKEALPNLSRIALLSRAEDSPAFVSTAEAAARGLGLAVRALKVAEVGEYENAFRTAQRERAGAILVLPSPIFNARRRVLIELAAKYRLPAIYEFSDYVRDGGLMSYGPNIAEMFRASASYVDRILKGAKPDDLPVQRPAIFELAINLKTAKALGLTISPSVLGRVDLVIE